MQISPLQIDPSIQIDAGLAEAIEKRQRLLGFLLAELADYVFSFRSSLPELAVISKADDSPVTEIDFLVQAAMTEVIVSKFPLDQILGEESIDDDMQMVLETKHAQLFHQLKALAVYFAEDHQYKMQWIIDPIDGTKGFIINQVYAIGAAITYGNMAVASGIAACNLALVFENVRAMPVVAMASLQAVLPRFFYTDGLEICPNDNICENMVLLSRTEMSKFPVQDYADLPFKMIGIDSMAKYVAVALGWVAGYARAPVSGNIMIWDHLPGIFLIACTGGESLDFAERPILCYLETASTVLQEGLLVSTQKGWASQFISIMAQSRLTKKETTEKTKQ